LTPNTSEDPKLKSFMTSARLPIPQMPLIQIHNQAPDLLLAVQTFPKKLVELDNEAGSAGTLCQAWRRLVFEFLNFSLGLSAPLNLHVEAFEKGDVGRDVDIRSSEGDEVRLPAPPTRQNSGQCADFCSAKLSKKSAFGHVSSRYLCRNSLETQLDKGRFMLTAMMVVMCHAFPWNRAVREYLFKGDQDRWIR
jgi:hypothetical protein